MGAADFAGLRGTLSLYERTSSCSAKYTALGHDDPKTQRLTRFANNTAFTRSRRGQTQLAANLGFCDRWVCNPAIAAADNEIAASTGTAT